MMGEEGKLQNFLADLLIFINSEQLTFIEEEKETENLLSWQLFIKAFYLLKREGIRHPFYPHRNILKQSWCFWWTERYKIGGYPAFELSLSTTKYKNIPGEIKKLPKKIGDRDFKTILLNLVGARETLDNEKIIVLRDKSTHIYKRIDHKLVKIPLDDKQRKGLLQVLSFIRKKIKALEAINKRIIAMHESGK